MTSIARTFLIHVLAAWALALAAAGGAIADDVRITFREGGTPIERAGGGGGVAVKLSRPGPAVVLPYFIVDMNDANGVTTFYAVRNRSAETVKVRYTYHRSDRGLVLPAVTEIENLGPHETRSVNVRSIAGLPTSGGIATGYMIAEVVDSTTGLPVLDSTALSGDFFRVDQDNAFASGGPLLGFGPLNLSWDFCNSWDLRFYNGGTFSGGTDIAFYVPYNPGGTDPVVTGNVYGEDGTFEGTVEITTSDYAFEVNSSDLDLPVAFGTVEWVFRDLLAGHVGGIFSALGKFSVGTPAICVDDLEELEPDVAESLAAQAAATAVATAKVTYAAALLAKGVALDWDPGTGWWTLAIDLATGQRAGVRFQIQDDEGHAQQFFDLSTAAFLLDAEAGGERGSVALDLRVSGLGLLAGSLLVDGSGIAIGMGRTGVVTIEELEIPKTLGAYPTSGTILVAAGDIGVTVTFDGTRYAQGSYTDSGVTVTFTIDLLTGEVIGL